MAEFFNMGGYAFFVWTCFGLTAAILVYNAIQPVFRQQQIKREIKGQLTRDQRQPTPSNQELD